MSWARGCLLILLFFANVARADEETVEPWEAWLRAPLLLNEAEVEDLARLPWIDRGLAEAIVGLRRAGGLQRLDDLRRIPGLDPERIAAIAPFVRLETPVPPARFRWESVGSLRDAELAALRSRFEVQKGAWWLGMQGHDQGAERTRVAASWSGRRVQVIAGRIVLRRAWSLLVADPALRSRTAPPPLGRGSRLAARLSAVLPAWWGGGLDWRPGPWRLLLAIGRPDELVPWRVQVEVERSLPGKLSPRLGLAWRGSGTLGLWLAFTGETVRGRVELVRPGLAPSPSFPLDRSLRGSAALEWRHASSRFGLAFTQSQAGEGGQDPLTGQLLDREHRSWQGHGSLRRGGWSLSALARELRRGRVGAMVIQRRWQVEASGPWSRSRLRLRFRLDEREGLTSRWSIAIDWRESVPDGTWGRGLSLRRALSAQSESLLLVLHLERGVRWFLRGSVGLARGDASSLWAVGLPTVGLSSAWLAPQEWGALLAWGHRVPGVNACLWARYKTASEPARAWAGGVGLRMVWGGAR